MTSRMNAQVRQSKIEGSGVFATKQIPVEKKIGAFVGKKVTIPQLKKRYESGKERKGMTDPFQISLKEYLLLKKPYRQINHSCSPNAILRGKNQLIAFRTIEKGEEITYDYSTTEWPDDTTWGNEKAIYRQHWKMPCECKSRECRKTITEFPYLSADIKKKYLSLNALPNHILRRWKK